MSTTATAAPLYTSTEQFFWSLQITLGQVLKHRVWLGLDDDKQDVVRFKSDVDGCLYNLQVTYNGGLAMWKFSEDPEEGISWRTFEPVDPMTSDYALEERCRKRGSKEVLRCALMHIGPQ